MSTEDKILIAAYNIFLLFGYHGTTLRQIALQAGVNKSAVHYYFRSKEGLYKRVVKKVIDLIPDLKYNKNTSRKRIEQTRWFLITEMYNNKKPFEKVVKELYPDDWAEKINCIMKLLKFKTIPYYLFHLSPYGAKSGISINFRP